MTPGKWFQNGSKKTELNGTIPLNKMKWDNTNLTNNDAGINNIMR